MNFKNGKTRLLLLLYLFRVEIFFLKSSYIRSAVMESNASKHTGDTDFVSDFISDYFAFCTCAEGTSCLHFSHFVLNCQTILLDIFCGYYLIITASDLGSNLNIISFTVKMVFNTVNGILV